MAPTKAGEASAFMQAFWQTLQLHEVSLVDAPPRGNTFRGEYEGLLLRLRPQAYPPTELTALVGALESVLRYSLTDNRAFLANANEFLSSVSLPLAVRKRGVAPHRDAVVPSVLILDLRHLSESDGMRIIEFLTAFQSPGVGLDQDTVRKEETERRLSGISDGFIRCDLILGNQQVRADRLQAIIDALRPPQEGVQCSSDNSSPLTLGTVSVSVDALAIDVAGVTQLEELVTSGAITLRNCAILGDDPDVDPLVYYKVLRALIPLTTTHRTKNSLSASVSSPQAERCFTAVVSSNPSVFAQLCSALMVATTVDSLQLKFKPGAIWFDCFERNSMMWFIHTVFSGSKTSSIRHLRMPGWRYARAGCNINDLNEYAQSRNPTALLFLPTWGQANVERAQSQHPKRVVIKEGTPLEIRRGQSEIPVIRDQTKLQVIYEDETHVHVIVPGFGYCRVPRSAVTQELAEPLGAACGRLDRHAVESLMLVSPSNERASNCRFPELIRIIGYPLKHLTFKNQGGMPNQAALAALWEHCPQLQQLLLYRLHEYSLRHIVDAYQSGQCRLSSLGFLALLLTGGHDAVAFLDAVADLASDGSHSIQELVVCPTNAVYADAPFRATSIVIDALERVLSHNDTLRFVGVSTPDPQATSLLTHDNSPVSGVYDRLPFRSKLAFLSVVESLSCEPRRKSKSRTTPLAMAKLDKPVLAKILSMGAAPVRRHVQVTVTIDPVIDRENLPSCCMQPEHALLFDTMHPEELHRMVVEVAAAAAAVPLPDEDDDL